MIKHLEHQTSDANPKILRFEVKLPLIENKETALILEFPENPEKSREYIERLNRIFVTYQLIHGSDGNTPAGFTFAIPEKKEPLKVIIKGNILEAAEILVVNKMLSINIYEFIVKKTIFEPRAQYLADFWTRAPLDICELVASFEYHSPPLEKEFIPSLHQHSKQHNRKCNIL